MSEARRCYIGLGSNLNQPAARIRDAVSRIEALSAFSDCRLSSLYRSPPWGKLDQPDFVNAVMECRSALAPRTMLAELLAVERSMGRERGAERWGPRVIDLDLLHVEGEQLRDSDADDLPALVLPHPRVAERAFVLKPWLDLIDDIELPGFGSLRYLASQVDCSSLSRL